MSTIADEVALYIYGARVVQLTRMCQVAPYVAMLYDHLLTFDLEVEHIWKRQRSMSTVLYVVLRYVGGAYGLFSASALLVHGSSKFCKVFVILQGWPATMTVWLVQFILQMRLYVLYKHSKKLLVFMGLAYITQIVVQSTILTLANIGTQTVNEPLPGIYICASTRIPPIFYSFWYAPITFECILCLLALWVGIKRSREEFHLVPIGAGTRLVDVLILGNVLYFVGILLACIANAAIWQSLGSDWLEVAEAFPQAVEVIAGCRLILHIRSAAARRSDDSQTSNIVHYQMQHIALRFADGEE